MEEFGYQDKTKRDGVYKTWLDIIEKHDGAGSQFWILTGIQDDDTLYPDYDGFRIVYPGSAASIISEHAGRMNEKSPDSR